MRLKTAKILACCLLVFPLVGTVPRYGPKTRRQSAASHEAERKRGAAVSARLHDTMEVFRAGNYHEALKQVESALQEAKQAQLPELVARATGDIGAYTVERVMRPEMKALRARIGVTPRDDLDGGNAVAIVKMADGRSIAESIDSYAPETDLTGQRGRLIRKFEALMTPLLGEKRTMSLEEAIFAIDKAPSVTPLIAMTGR